MVWAALVAGRDTGAWRESAKRRKGDEDPVSIIGHSDYLRGGLWGNLRRRDCGSGAEAVDSKAVERIFSGKFTWAGGGVVIRFAARSGPRPQHTPEVK